MHKRQLLKGGWVVSSRGSTGLAALAAGCLLMIVLLGGCGGTINGSVDPSDSPSPAVTFSDGSEMPAELLAAGELCNQLHPFDDAAFTACLLRGGSGSGSVGGGPPAVSESTIPDPPARIVGVGLIACPEFIEATFRNEGGQPASVEGYLHVGDSNRPYAIWPPWTSTIQPGAEVTWRITPEAMGIRRIPVGPIEVGMRGDSTGGQARRVNGTNPSSACPGVGSTSTSLELAQEGGVEIADSEAVCSATGATFTFKIANAGSVPIVLHQVALFPYAGDDHHFDDVDSWWPLPVVEPGEAVTHSDDFYFGESWNGTRIELYVAHSGGVEIMEIPCW